MAPLALERRPIALHIDGTTIHDDVLVPHAHRQHAHTRAAGHDSLAWLQAMGLLQLAPAQSFARAGFHELIGFIYLDENREDLALCAEFACLLFATDDLFDDHEGLPWRAETGRATAVMDVIQRAGRTGYAEELFACAPAADRPGLAAVSRAYADLSRRLSAGGRDISRYLAALDTYLEGTAAETTARRLGGYRSVDAYLDARCAFSAVDLAIELGLVLREQTQAAASPAWADMARATNVHVSVVNDLYSLDKERGNGEVSNAVIVLEQLHGLSLREAVHETCRMVDRATLVYAEARGELASPATALLEHWMRGSYEWHAQHSNARYTVGVSVAPNARTALQRSVG